MSQINPQTYQIASVASARNYTGLKPETVDQLKKHLLDSAGSLFYSLNRPTVQKPIHQINELSQGGRCRVPLIGNVACDRAAQRYTALIRYPDFMDNYLGKEAINASVSRLNKSIS